jgi:hypothetical protein
MNDKDKEAFENWIDNDVLSHDENNRFKNMSEQERVVFVTERTWQAACEYKDKEIGDLKFTFKSLNDDALEIIDENKKLRKALHQLKGLFLRNYDIGLDYINEALKEVGQ